MSRRNLHNLPWLKEKRKNLRNNGTSAEATLWTYLQKKQLKGRKFRRQHSIGNYIVDFYCPSEKLAIELDGQHHYTPAGILKDQERDTYLKRMGIKVLHFENVEVFHGLEALLEKVVNQFDHP